jgi:hypothetical protein
MPWGNSRGVASSRIAEVSKPSHRRLRAFPFSAEKAGLWMRRTRPFGERSGALSAVGASKRQCPARPAVGHAADAVVVARKKRRSDDLLMRRLAHLGRTENI